MATKNPANPKQPQNSEKNRKNKRGDRRGLNITTLPPALEPHKFQPGVSGNPGGRPAKPFTAALLRIVEKKLANDPEGRVLLDGIAQQLVAKATKGDLASIRELADRIEGTPARSVEVTGPNQGPIQFADMTPEEKQNRLAELLARQTTGGKDGKRKR